MDLSAARNFSGRFVDETKCESPPLFVSILINDFSKSPKFFGLAVREILVKLQIPTEMLTRMQHRGGNSVMQSLIAVISSSSQPYFQILSGRIAEILHLNSHVITEKPLPSWLIDIIHLEKNIFQSNVSAQFFFGGFRTFFNQLTNRSPQ